MYVVSGVYSLGLCVIDDITEWLSKFSDFCSKCTVDIASDDIMYHILVCDHAINDHHNSISSYFHSWTMVPKREQQRMRRLLSEAINVLCKASLPFKAKFTVEGLLGITLDDEEILLINVDEIVELPGETSQGTGNIHIEAVTKWPPFRWWPFQMHFLEWNW